MRQCHSCRRLGASYLQRHDRNLAERRLLERRAKSFGIARSFNEQANRIRLGQVEREVQVLVHRYAELVAR